MFGQAGIAVEVCKSQAHPSCACAMLPPQVLAGARLPDGEEEWATLRSALAGVRSHLRSDSSVDLLLSDLKDFVSMVSVALFAQCASMCISPSWHAATLHLAAACRHDTCCVRRSSFDAEECKCLQHEHRWAPICCRRW